MKERWLKGSGLREQVLGESVLMKPRPQSAMWLTTRLSHATKLMLAAAQSLLAAESALPRRAPSPNCARRRVRCRYRASVAAGRRECPLRSGSADCDLSRAPC